MHQVVTGLKFIVLPLKRFCVAYKQAGNGKVTSTVVIRISNFNPMSQSQSRVLLNSENKALTCI